MGQKWAQSYALYARLVCASSGTNTIPAGTSTILVGRCTSHVVRHEQTCVHLMYSCLLQTPVVQEHSPNLLLLLLLLLLLCCHAGGEEVKRGTQDSCVHCTAVCPALCGGCCSGWTVRLPVPWQCNWLTVTSHLGTHASAKSVKE
jgi:hypothetical protein